MVGGGRTSVGWFGRGLGFLLDERGDGGGADVLESPEGSERGGIGRVVDEGEEDFGHDFVGGEVLG